MTGVKGEHLVARVHAHPSIDRSQNGLSSLRYFRLPPVQPLCLALVDPIDRFAEMNSLMELSKREIRLRSLVSDPHQTRLAEVLSGIRCGDVVALNGPGYYRTGDIARKEGKYYFITGRASVDNLKSGGYKISTLDIEREPPYISEVMVIRVVDLEYATEWVLWCP